jgi:glycosyltransferase involved in cell wall biosynthesis
MEKKIRKRLLLISPFCPPSVGGAETHLEDLYEYLRTHDYFVYVLTYQPLTVAVRGQPLEKKANLEIHRFSWFGHNLFHQLEKHHPVFNFLYLTPYLLLRSLLFMMTHRHHVKTINAHGLNAAFIALVLKKLFKKRAVMSTMALYNFQPGTLFTRVTALVLASLDKVIAETEESKEEIVKIGVPKEKIVVFSHWVDQNKFKPEDKRKAKKRLDWQKKFIVLFVGRAIPIKGGDTLTKVVTKINSKINFAIIADAGPHLDLLKKTAQKYKNFIFVGGVPYEELPRYYQAADLFVIPSRYEEGAARVMMEAVACGLPVVASNRGAIPSVLDESVAVFVNPDEKSLRRAIENLYQDQKKLKQLAQNCLPYASRHFGFANAKVITQAY